ncbi:BASS family bile acid:Na+ symporter [Halopolyspora algeriensis]|uniref:BASS family bile acid:Na+ symporter n=1 Tax=Halopolyspora algeriensis TaxID=1500506 RepID=A0A368VH45_9ACTN|nr:bile acid:sodium symporter family protein [Halopolyspora algeriensis]RCW40709.1 BASS family bile acid:Na+ symporter [Halopolyspora algeriensis]TQM53368.1 BASS family bile acid:Na+ symporter [Halopolyspora algeriensis]
MNVLTSLAGLAGRWFAALVLLGGVVGLLAPGPTAALASAIPVILGVIMFGMGLTLRPADFAIVARRPQAVVAGVVAQFLVMPLVGWAVGAAFGFAPALLVGMVLVGASPGGTASNVVVYLARGDVALSVAMTSVSTLLAPVLTPVLVLWLAGSTLPVDAAELFLSIVQVVLVPVIAGLLLRWLASRWVERLLPVLPLVSVTGIVVAVAAVVGANVDALLASGLLLALAVVVHNMIGLALGYGAARAAGLDTAARRAVSVEVGMQNSGLAASLATTHFTPLAALPAALFSVWHNMSGSLVAMYWARRPVADRAAELR